MNIRTAERRDLSAMLDIYNYEVKNGTATFDVEPRAGAADRLVAVGVELFGVDMRVGVDQIIQCFGNFVLKYFVYRVGVSLF